MGENYITYQSEKGNINISEDVLVSMVRTVIGEIDGVSSLASGASGELAELLGLKSVSKGLKVQINDGVITVDVIINVRYGYSVVKVAEEVQQKVTGVVEATTGMGSPVVNVHVSGVAFSK